MSDLNLTIVLPNRAADASRRAVPLAVVLWPGQGGFAMPPIDARVARAHCLLHCGEDRDLPKERPPRR